MGNDEQQWAGAWTTDAEAIARVRAAEVARATATTHPNAAPGAVPGQPGGRRRFGARLALLAIPAAAAFGLVALTAIGSPSPGAHSAGPPVTAPSPQNPDSTSTAHVASPGSSTTSTTITLWEANFHPGDCVSWDQSAGLSPYGRATTTVSCAEPHLVEIVAEQQMDALDAAYPGQASLTAFIAQTCGPRASQYLGYAIDPYGRFAVTALVPTEAGWLQGDRRMWCDLQLHTPPNGRFTSFRGRVQGADQSLLVPVGSCLPLLGQEWSVDPVSCSQPHAVEVTGNVDLTGKIRQLPTSPAQWQAAVGAACGQLALTYLGGSYPPGLQSSWSPIEPSSWATGRRTVQCVVGKPAGDSWTQISTPFKQLPR